jgi:hypothetical protein
MRVLSDYRFDDLGALDSNSVAQLVTRICHDDKERQRQLNLFIIRIRQQYVQFTNNRFIFSLHFFDGITKRNNQLN